MTNFKKVFGTITNHFPPEFSDSMISCSIMCRSRESSCLAFSFEGTSCILGLNIDLTLTENVIYLKGKSIFPYIESRGDPTS